jgi:hypothetical protein
MVMFRRQKGSASKKKVWEALGKTNNQCNNVYLAGGKTILRTQQTPKNGHPARKKKPHKIQSKKVELSGQTRDKLHRRHLSAESNTNTA